MTPPPDLPAPPRLRHSPLFWGGLLTVVFVLFAWGISCATSAGLHRTTAGPAGIGSITHISSSNSGINYYRAVNTALLHPAPTLPAAWIPSGSWHPTLDLLPVTPFPAPRWSDLRRRQEGSPHRGVTEIYDIRVRTFTLPYWLLLAIVTPLWLLALRLSRRRFHGAAAAAAIFPPA